MVTSNRYGARDNDWLDAVGTPTDIVGVYVTCSEADENAAVLEKPDTADLRATEQRMFGLRPALDVGDGRLRIEATKP